MHAQTYSGTCVLSIALSTQMWTSIRQNLEYAAPVWSPRLQKDMLQQFPRRICTYCYTSFWTSFTWLYLAVHYPTIPVESELLDFEQTKHIATWFELELNHAPQLRKAFQLGCSNAHLLKVQSGK